MSTDNSGNLAQSVTLPPDIPTDPVGAGVGSTRSSALRTPSSTLIDRPVSNVGILAVQSDLQDPGTGSESGAPSSRASVGQTKKTRKHRGGARFTARIAKDIWSIVPLRGIAEGAQIALILEQGEDLHTGWDAHILRASAFVLRRRTESRVEGDGATAHNALVADLFGRFKLLHQYRERHPRTKDSVPSAEERDKGFDVLEYASRLDVNLSNTERSSLHLPLCPSLPPPVVEDAWSGSDDSDNASEVISPAFATSVGRADSVDAVHPLTIVAAVVEALSVPALPTETQSVDTSPIATYFGIGHLRNLLAIA